MKKRVTKKRARYAVRFSRKDDHWVIVMPGGRHYGFYFPNKGVTLVQARRLARRETYRLARRPGRHSQLVIYKKNGRIQTEHTYGADPRRTKG